MVMVGERSGSGFKSSGRPPGILFVARTRGVEVPGESAGPGSFASALNGNPFDGVAFLNVIHVFEEVQIYLEAVRGFHRVWGLPFNSILSHFVTGNETCKQGGKRATGIKVRVGGLPMFLKIL